MFSKEKSIFPPRLPLERRPAHGGGPDAIEKAGEFRARAEKLTELNS
jgi:hypothetical protein